MVTEHCGSAALAKELNVYFSFILINFRLNGHVGLAAMGLNPTVLAKHLP